MTVLKIKQDFNKEELKNKGIILCRLHDKFYIRDIGVKFRTRGNIASMTSGSNKDSSGTADCNLRCPHCGSNIFSMDMSIPIFFDSVRCNNRKCKKDVGMFELIATNEAVVKSYMNDNFIPKNTR